VSYRAAYAVPLAWVLDWNVDMRRLSFVLLLVATPAFAQVPGESSFAKTVAPFIDEHTLVVARMDATRADVETILKLASTVIGNGEEAAEAKEIIRSAFKQFIKLGGKDVFVTYGPGDFPHAPCLITPAPADESTRKQMAAVLAIPFKYSGVTADSVVLHDCVCVGTSDALAVLKSRKAVARPELIAALDVGAGDVMQIAFAMSAEAKKIHEQVSPTLPTELGGGGIQKITRGMKWMALTVGPGPKMPAKWITECTNPQAAQDLREVERHVGELAANTILKIDGTDPGAAKRVAGIFDHATSTQEGPRLTTNWELATAFLEAMKRPEGAPADRMRSANNLKQLMIALHNYHDAHGHFPTDVRDKDNKPLLSWRVLILPYMDHEHLYKQFKLDEPWDSENNKKLIEKMPKPLRSPRQAATLKDSTTYLAPLGKGFMWDEPNGLKITQITDGTSNTIALVEADDERAVIWSKPEDITIDSKNPIAGLLGHYTDGFQAAMADGSVRWFKKGLDPVAQWAWFTRSGGEVVDNK
jgi:hypothetical protein